MSQIKDDKTAKGGLDTLLGRGSNTEVRTLGTVQVEQRTNLTREELEETLPPDIRESLEAIHRRQYLKSGRPLKGEKREIDYTRMTFIVDQKKQIKLREIALKERLFIKEVLDRGIDLVIEKYEKEGKI